MGKKKRQTNVEMLTNLMEFSHNGPMMQAFVLEACRKYANQVINSDASEWPENYIISYDLWKRCASELDNTLNEHFKKVS